MTDRYRVLIVDDNPSLCELVSETLRESFDVFRCHSGEQALERIGEVMPHIVLLDIMMPGMNGFETCRRIREDGRMQSVKILFLSARASLQDRLTGYELQGDDYLSKPFDTEELKAKVGVYARLIREEEKRKAVEGQLRESEEKYRSLVENSPEIIIVHTDVRGIIEFSNLEFSEHYNGMIPKSVFDLIPGESHQLLQSAIDSVLETSRVASFESRIRGASERDIWYSTRIGPIKKAGRVEGLTFFSRDVTERKQVEKELIDHKENLEKLVNDRTRDLQQEITENQETKHQLKKSEEKYRSILESIEEGYYELDLDGKVTFYNTSLSDILNIPDDWLQGRDIKTLDKIVDIRKLEETLEYVKTTGRSSPVMKWEIPLLNGGFKYLETSISLIKEGDKKLGFRGIIRDITERLAHEKTLEGLFTHAVGTLARAAEVFDQDTGDHTVRIGDYSRQLAALIGMNEQFLKDVRISAQLHDVGKIHIASSILTKSGRLTDDEFESIKNHTLYGSIIIGKNPDFKMANEIAMFHHEKWNGQGYPDGLKGRAIPLAARITAIVDVFDALVSKRSYKRPYSYQEARTIMQAGDSRLNPSESFDPNLLNAFLDNYHLFTKIHQDSLAMEREIRTKILNVVVLEDDVELVSAIRDQFMDTVEYAELFGFSTIAEISDYLAENPNFSPDLCFIDVNLPDGSGHDAAQMLKNRYPEAHLICITADEDIDITKVNLYGHRVFRKIPHRMSDFMNNLIKSAEIIREYHHNPLKLV